MIHGTLRKLWLWTGASGALMLAAAWADSQAYRTSLDSGSSSKRWREFHVWSGNSALHFASESFPEVFRSWSMFQRGDTPPSVDRRALFGEEKSGEIFPGPAMGKEGHDKTEVTTQGLYSIPPPDYEFYLMLPYWLLLAGWIGSGLLGNRLLLKWMARSRGRKTAEGGEVG